MSSTFIVSGPASLSLADETNTPTYNNLGLYEEQFQSITQKEIRENAETKQT